MTALASLTDRIVAVATGWGASARGVIRVSGPGAWEAVTALSISEHTADWRPQRWIASRLSVFDEADIPGRLLFFRGPLSYTGQDLAEIHTVGSLPVLRDICERLLASGARRALPGEFTARAFAHGKLDRTQAAGIYGLIHAESAAALRRAARLASGVAGARLAALRADLVELLALIEAGIDFVEEEGISFITPAEVARRLRTTRAAATDLLGLGRAESLGGLPHVALVGRPNAGKSTLFNALLGHERAIVAPVVGTTRDVLSAELACDGLRLMLQDCAGLGATDDELELAAHRATEAAADRADVVLWVHPAGEPWRDDELAAAHPYVERGLILVLSKADLVDASTIALPVPLGSTAAVCVSCATGAGLAALRSALADAAGKAASGWLAPLNAPALQEALDRAILLASADVAAVLTHPELVALELREALRAWRDEGDEPDPDEVLGQIFGRFCVGK